MAGGKRPLFIFSLGYAFYSRIPPAVDAKAYDAIAWNLAQGYGYKENRDLAYEKDYALGRAGPGYEFFLAGVYTAFGHRYWPVWILQSIFHVLSGFFILLTYRLFAKKENPDDKNKNSWLDWFVVLGLFLFLFHPDLIQMNGMLMTEPLFIFLTAGALFAGLRVLADSDYNFSSKWRLILIFAALASFAVLVRPAAFLFFLIFAASFLYKKYWKEAAIIFAILLIAAGPWILRNYSRHGILFTNATGGLELWVSVLPESGGEFQMNEEVSDYLSQNGLFKTAERGKEEFKNFIFKNPLSFLTRQLEKTSIYFSMLRTSGFWLYLSGSRRLITTIFSAIFNFLIFSLGLSGFYVLFKKKKFLNNLFLLISASLPISVIPIIVTGRYRYAFLAFLTIGAIVILRFISEEKRIPGFVWLISAFLILNSGLDAIWHFSKVLSHLKALGF